MNVCTEGGFNMPYSPEREDQRTSQAQHCCWNQKKLWFVASFLPFLSVSVPTPQHSMLGQVWVGSAQWWGPCRVHALIPSPSSSSKVSATKSIKAIASLGLAKNKNRLGCTESKGNWIAYVHVDQVWKLNPKVCLILWMWDDRGRKYVHGMLHVTRQGAEFRAVHAVAPSPEAWYRKQWRQYQPMISIK